MSKNLRNSIIYCIAACTIVGSSFPLIADTASTTTTPTKVITPTTIATNQEATPTENNVTGYIPPNNKSETIYVNLDNYGVPTQTQVVNGYCIDGESKIVDYGHYSEVINLTNYATPTISGDQITWNLEEDVTNFYYQGTLDHIDLPWEFTIRYKLNGVETKAEDLAGASGMIETIIDVTPNENVPDYLKNNFFLQLSTSYDMGKCLSVEAPDGVEVTLGATKSLTFMAMPGETATFHIYVGSEQYESTGFNVVIAPLKMSALDEVTNLKEAKEDLEDAYNAANDSLDIILDSTSDIQGGLTKLNNGLSKVQSSLEAFRSDDAITDEKVNTLIDSSNKLNESLALIAPHIDNTQNFIDEMNTAGNETISDLNALLPLLEESKSALIVFEEDCSNLQDLIENTSSTGERLDGNLEALKKGLVQVSNDLTRLNTSLQNLGYTLDGSQGSLQQVSSSLSSLRNELEFVNSLDQETIDQYIAAGMLSPEAVDVLQKMSGMSDELGNVSNILSNTGYLANDSTDTITVLRSLSLNLSTLSNVLVSVTDNLQDVNSSLTNYSDQAISNIEQLNILLNNLVEASDVASEMITDIDETQNIVNTYIPDLKQLLTDTSSLITNTHATTSAMTDLGTQVHTTITNNRQQAYDSMDQTLEGSRQTFNEIIDALEQTNDLKKNKDIIKNTIDDEWDKLDDDFNLLDYDPQAKPISLVSDKNTNINNVQIILRTPEITIDKKAELKVAEETEVELTMWQRIKNIFSNMFN